MESRMDVLSTILKTMKLEGAMFYKAEFSAPWNFRAPTSRSALALLHRQPSDPWTVAELAKRVRVARSVPAERFRHFLSVPPMACFAHWRPQVGT